MNASELKLKIFRQVDSLESNRLDDLYGVLLNFINGQRDTDDWAGLTSEQKQGILDAIEQMDTGKGIPHDVVMSRFNRKYSNN